MGKRTTSKCHKEWTQDKKKVLVGTRSIGDGTEKLLLFKPLVLGSQGGRSISEKEGKK